jgi:hypothetical protein
MDDYQLEILIKLLAENEQLRRGRYLLEGNITRTLDEVEKMRERLTGEELTDFEKYAKDNMTDFDGTQSQWADYTVRMVDEIRYWREKWDDADFVF